MALLPLHGTKLWRRKIGDVAFVAYWRKSVHLAMSGAFAESMGWYAVYLSRIEAE